MAHFVTFNTVIGGKLLCICGASVVEPETILNVAKSLFYSVGYILDFLLTTAFWCIFMASSNILLVNSS